MVNKIVEGIAKQIRLAFPAGEYSVYTEQIKQGLKEPCFFILPLTVTPAQLIGNRSRHNNSFDIHYFPLEKKNKDMNEAIVKLIDVLECIEVDGNLIRATKMNTEKQDGILHFFVQYSMLVKKEAPTEPPMEEVKIEAKVKEVDHGRKR